MVRFLIGTGTKTKIKKEVEDGVFTTFYNTKTLIKELINRKRGISLRADHRIEMIDKDIEKLQVLIEERRKEQAKLEETKRVILFETYKIRRF